MQLGDVTPKARFLGYRTIPEPRLEFEWHGKLVAWTVRAAPKGVGLQYTIEIPDLQASDVVGLRFGDEVRVVCAKGKFEDGWLRVPGAAAGEFTVTLTRPKRGAR